MSEGERRALMRTDWGFVHQESARGLRMNVSAGGNIGERLMAVGDRHYGNIRACALDWLHAGSRFAAACERLAAAFPEADVAKEAGMLLRRWIEEGLLAGVVL